MRAGRPVPRRGIQIAGLLAIAAAALPAPALGAADTPLPPPRYPQTPSGYEITAHEAKRIADGTPLVAEMTAEHGLLATAMEAKQPDRWQIGYLAHGKEILQIHIASDSGQILETWTGDAVAWSMARGYEGQFGHALNAPYVWIPLALIFICGLLDWRRPLRIVHLDLLVLLSFGISHLFFNLGEIGWSVPLAYPPLIYLLARMVWIGFRGGGRGLRPSTPTAVLAILICLLVAFRVTLNVADSSAIDVGYAGVVGADRIADGEPIYGEGVFPENNRFGDTYGPANYYAYVPFELAMPWHGTWDELPAAHGAALFFDLATIAGLFLLGRRLGRGEPGAGNRLGLVLAFAWCAYPYSGFALQSNSNDSLIAALVVWALVAISSPFLRGGLIGLAGMAKFGALALGPLYATAERGLIARIRPGPDDPLLSDRSAWRRLAPVVAAAAGLLVSCAVMLAHPAIDPGLGTFWERTVKSQAERVSPFSVWGQAPSLQWLQTATLALGACFAVAIGFVPRRRTLVQIAALGAAATILLELGLEHWFYLYIPWFLPLAYAAMTPARPEVPEPAAEPERSGGVPERVGAVALMARPEG